MRADWSVAVICEDVDQLRPRVLSLPPEEGRPYSDINDGKIPFLSVSRRRDFSRNVARKWTLETIKVEMGSKQVGKRRQNVYKGLKNRLLL